MDFFFRLTCNTFIGNLQLLNNICVHKQNSQTRIAMTTASATLSVLGIEANSINELVNMWVNS